MRNFFGIPYKNRRDLGVNIKHHFQMVSAALQRRHGNHIVDHRSDIVSFFRCRERALHDLRIVKNIIDLAGQTFTGQLYGLYILVNLSHILLTQGHFADADYHIDRSPQFMGYI